MQIEEPFSILPLPEICADLHTSAQLAVTQRKLVRCLAAPDSCDADWEVRGVSCRGVCTGIRGSVGPCAVVYVGACACAWLQTRGLLGLRCQDARVELITVHCRRRRV